MSDASKSREGPAAALIRKITPALNPCELDVARGRFFGNPVMPLDQLAGRYRVTEAKVAQIGATAWTKIHKIDGGKTQRAIRQYAESQLYPARKKQAAVHGCP